MVKTQGMRRDARRIRNICVELHRQETGLPVVGMRDVVADGRFEGPGERGLRQEGEALGIVGIVMA